MRSSLRLPFRARRHRREQAGDSWSAMMIWGIISIVVLFISAKMLMPKYNEYLLETKLEEIVHFQGRPDADSLMKEVLDMAQRERIPITEENVYVRRAGSSTTIRVTFDQEVDLKVIKYIVHTDIEKQSNQY